jgi:hypothetical protein
MSTKADQVAERFEIKRYKIQYPLSAYTFPREARIHQVQFDDKNMRVELTDGRVISVPLWWIPTLYNATPQEREKFSISRDRAMIVWDPAKCAINDEVRIADYMIVTSEANPSAEEQSIERRPTHAPRQQHARRPSASAHR